VSKYRSDISAVRSALLQLALIERQLTEVQSWRVRGRLLAAAQRCCELGDRAKLARAKLLDLPAPSLEFSQPGLLSIEHILTPSSAFEMGDASAQQILDFPRHVLFTVRPVHRMFRCTGYLMHRLLAVLNTSIGPSSPSYSSLPSSPPPSVPPPMPPRPSSSPCPPSYYSSH